MIMKPLTDRSRPGYTLDELQVQRSINDARIMVQKMVLQRRVAELRRPRTNEAHGVFGKMVNALGYVDYAVLVVTAVRRITSIVSRFRK